MGLDAQLQALTVPFGTEFPGTVQALLVLIAQYEEIIGLENFNGINFGSVEPTPENRDKPWFKTDGSGNPIGWYSWNGSAWTPIPMRLPSGATASRPPTPGAGELFLDTTLNTPLIFERSQWRTLSGVTGDTKEVKFATLAAALAANPGWSHDTDSVGRVVGGAADGTDPAYASTAGADSVTLTIGNLPAHAHTFNASGNAHADGNAPGGGLSDKSVGATSSVGSADAVDVRQPTIYYWRLVKD